MKKYLKAFLKKPRVIKAGAWLVAQYISFVYKTSSWKIIGDEYPKAYWKEKKPFIVCFWHNRLLMACFAWQGETLFHMLISSHPDGRIIAETVGFHGIKTIAGSTSKGGAEALRKMLKTLKSGNAVGITPDGPRGPRFHVSDGILTLAKLSGCDVLPVTYSLSKRKVLRSWDRFVFAKPFSKGVILWGAPMHLSRDADETMTEDFRLKIEKSLTSLCDQADTMCYVDPIK